MSITNVFKKAFEAKKQVKQSAADQYRDLLHKNASVPADKWSATDEAKLFELIDILQISEDKATKDASVVKEMTDLSNLASTAASTAKAYDKAHIAHQKVLEDRQRITLELMAKVSASIISYDDAMTAMQNASRAKGTLDNLKEAHPHLAK